MQGLAIGWLRTVTDGGQIVGPLVMGICADALGLSVPFQLGALLLVGAAGWCRPLRSEATMPTREPDDG